MEHRHIDTQQWSASTIDSALEYGGLKDWQDLFAAARADKQVAELVLKVVSHRELGGASILAKALLSPQALKLGDVTMPSKPME